MWLAAAEDVVFVEEKTGCSDSPEVCLPPSPVCVCVCMLHPADWCFNNSPTVKAMSSSLLTLNLSSGSHLSKIKHCESHQITVHSISRNLGLVLKPVLVLNQPIFNCDVILNIFFYLNVMCVFVCTTQTCFLPIQSKCMYRALSKQQQLAKEIAKELNQTQSNPFFFFFWDRI